MLRLTHIDQGFEIRCGADSPVILRHTSAEPAFAIASGTPEVLMHRGNFQLADCSDAPAPLRLAQIARDRAGHVVIILRENLSAVPRLVLKIDANRICFSRMNDDPANRLWVTLPATPGEAIWGAGEQMSYFNLRGPDSPRHFPLWTSEPGVGRDKSTAITQAADLAHAGGDYWTTNYPQPTFLSSAGYACHVDTTAYAAFDFRCDDAHRIEIWDIPASIEFYAGTTPDALVRQLATRFGHPPALPAWSTSGAIIGLKDGDASFDRLAAMRKAGVAVSGLWCEDWCGVRQTSFGTRLFWDWQWNPKRYTDLPGKIAALARDDIRFLGYTNPYVAVDGPQYAAAAAQGFLARRQDADTPYAVDFGEFDAGIVDFTNPAAADWFAQDIIGRQMIDFGLSGWMADFGEYLPTDVRLHSGEDPMLAHNAWPVLWAKVNADAVAKRGRTGDIMFFMRAGHSGVQAHNPLLWAGDQCVDFSRHDGIGTVITAALSSGMVGNPYHHSDTGGYTSLGFVRSAKLIARWSELSAFTPVMRTHEGNRPRDNLQVDSTAEILAHFAAFTRVHAALAPYVAVNIAETVATGLPLQRALFIDYPDCREAYGVQDQYLYGRDLLVAPVITEGAIARRVLIPAAKNGSCNWVHMWTGRHYGAGWHDVAAPIGQPPVFFAGDSHFAALFTDIARDHMVLLSKSFGGQH